jgi:O-antigen/teichoic acid export membrane protein
VTSQNVLTFIFGKLLPISTVGQFSQANKWNTMANSFISGTMFSVAQPVFANAGEDKERQERVFRKMLRFTSFLTFPLMFGLALVANEFILLLLGAKWAGSVLLLQILCIGGAFIPLYEVYQNFLMSNGRSDVYMWGNIAQMVILLVTILLIYRQGIVAVVCASSVCSVCWLFIWQFICCRFIGGRFLDFVKDVIPFMLLSLLVMGVVYILTMGVSNLWLALLLRIVMAASLYFVIMKFAQAKILEECINFVRRKRKA